MFADVGYVEDASSPSLSDVPLAKWPRIPRPRQRVPVRLQPRPRATQRDSRARSRAFQREESSGEFCYLQYKCFLLDLS